MARHTSIAERTHRLINVEVGMDLAVWAMASGLPAVGEIQARFECSRATAYRFRQAMQDFIDRQAMRAPQKVAA